MMCAMQTCTIGYPVCSAIIVVGNCVSEPRVAPEWFSREHARAPAASSS
jgi:hypothetical protein